MLLEDCRIPVEHLLGGEEKLAKKLSAPLRPEVRARADALATFEVTRPLVGASALGIAQAAYEWTLEYLDAVPRERRGPMLQSASAIQQTPRRRRHRDRGRAPAGPARRLDGPQRRPDDRRQGSMSKLKAGDVTMWATTTLMDLVGPYAQTTECPLEKFFRDAKIYQLFEGTAEIQRMVISRMQAPRLAPSASGASGRVAKGRGDGRWPQPENGAGPAEQRRSAAC